MLWRTLFLIITMGVMAALKVRILHAIQDPNISLLLAAVGLTLVFAECLRPGVAVFAGIGGVLICVGVFGLSMQVISYPWLLAMAAGVLLIGVEALRPMHGIAGLAGITLVNFAGLMLCGGMKLSWTGPILTTVSALILLLLRFASMAWTNKHVAFSNF